MFKYGKKPARPESIKLKFSAYAKALPTPPVEFGHDAAVNPFHCLGNDRYGDCYFAGAAHEEYIYSALGSQRAHITTADVLDDYAAATGFNPADPATDQGTDMAQGAAYRRKIGIRDAKNIRHKVGAYASLRPGDIAEHKTATWLFGAVGLGLTVGDNQQEQFAKGEPWDGPLGSNSGGHYVSILAFRGGLLWVVTWGKVQAITPAFFAAQNDESVVYFSEEMLRGGKSPEGFDVAALNDDLAGIAG
jgi:hypothetical protein